MQWCMRSAEELLCLYPSGIHVIAHGEVKMQEGLVYVWQIWFKLRVIFSCWTQTHEDCVYIRLIMYPATSPMSGCEKTSSAYSNYQRELRMSWVHKSKRDWQVTSQAVYIDSKNNSHWLDTGPQRSLPETWMSCVSWWDARKSEEHWECRPDHQGASNVFDKCIH
jgi:hypothetical protein